MSSDDENNSEPYSVGNKRPPRDRQFKPGKSGNPTGRPKGSLNFKTLLAKELNATIKIQEAGKTKTISKQHAMIKQFVAKAIKGDEKAFGKLIPLIIAIGAEELTEMGHELTADQTLILKRNAARLLAMLAKKEGDQ